MDADVWPNLHQLFPQIKGSPLAWAIPAEVCERTRGLLKRIDSVLSKPMVKRQAVSLAAELPSWLSTISQATCELDFALECIAWCYAWPMIAEHVAPETQALLINELRTVVDEATTSPAIGLEQQILGTEVSLLLSCVVDDPNACQALLTSAQQSMRGGLHEFTTADGMPQFGQWTFSHGLLACWTRSLRWAEFYQLELLGDSDRIRFTQFARQSLRLMRHDGSPIWGDVSENRNGKQLLAAAVAASGCEQNAWLEKNLLFPAARPRHRKGKKNPTSPFKLQSLSAYSSSAQTAVMRSSGSGAAQLAVAFDGPRVLVEMNAGKQTLLSGEWTNAINVEGELLQPTSAWEEVCWFSDDAADLLEIELSLTNGWRLERQILLAREDQVAIFAEALLGEKSNNIELRSLLPLAPQIHFQPAVETREGLLRESPGLGLTLPLALPEWRADPEPGNLSQMGRSLELHQTGKSRSMYAPMFFDLHPRRKPKQFTWRRLSVGEELMNQPRDVAVGYRVQIEDRQWLLYRALASQGNRTVLGKNLCRDFFFGRFLADGATESLVELE